MKVNEIMDISNKIQRGFVILTVLLCVVFALLFGAIQTGLF